MPLQLQDADFNDGKAIANIFVSAFFDDPFQQSLYPGMSFDKQVAVILSRWPNEYGNFSAHYKIVVDTDSGEIVSYSKWEFVFTDAGASLRRSKGFPQNFKPELPSTPEGFNSAFAADFSRRMREIRERILGDRPQLHLRLIGSLPSSQRRGAASLHLSWATQLADEKGLTCWVEASPISVPLYMKFGFEIQDQVVVQLDESCGGGTQTSTCMMREPEK